jgi:6-pyruvoyltetrahydropterin/6-carboxytetrahydropterin synthase
MTVTRVYRFAASHRLYIGTLSAEQNEQLYGKCNNPYGHGHDYILHVSVTGDPDPDTGRVVNIGDLDRFVHESLLRFYDHADLNHDVPDFQGVPTTESLAADCMKRLKNSWPFRQARVERVRIRETERNTVEFTNSGE